MKKLNIEQLSQTLLYLETHAQAIRSGELENTWTQEDWQRYRHLKNTYAHVRRNEEKKKYERITFRKIRMYNDWGVI